MRRVAAAVLVLAVVAGGPAAVDDGRAAPPDARLSVPTVAVEPDTPVTGSPTTITATIRNGAGSAEIATIDRVGLRLVGGPTIDGADDLGTLGQGQSLTVPLTATFQRPGPKEVAVVAEGTDADGENVSVRRPLRLVTERAPPQIEVRAVDAIAGVPTTTEVAVANPTTEAMRNLVVTADAPGPDRVARRTVPELGAGDTTTLFFESVPRTAGEGPVRTTVTYTTAVGTERMIDRVETATVAPLRADVGVDVAPASEGGGGGLQLGGQLGTLLDGGGSGGGGDDEEEPGPPRRVEVTVTNFGNAPVREAVVTARLDGSSLSRTSVAGPIAPGESETATVSLVTVDRRGAVAFAVDYATGTERGQSTARFEYRPATGAIELTGVDLTLLDEDTLRIEGNAGNAGDATVRGVVLAVGDSPTVTPAYPQRDYFVGTVEGSEFAPFDLTATVDTANATTIPVRVTAVIDGETTTRTVALPYDEDLEPPDTGGGGFPTDLLIGAGLGAVLAGVVAVVLRLRRGGSDER